MRRAIRDRRRPGDPLITSPMVALAWEIDQGRDPDGKSAKVLAKLVLEAAGHGAGEGEG